MGKRISVLKKISVTILYLLLITVLSGKQADAAEETDRKVLEFGACGKLHYDEDDDIEVSKDVKYILYEDGTMVISGSGEMGDFESWEDCCIKYEMKNLMPWYEDRADIKKVVIEEGVTTIGNSSFYGCKNLRSIQWADSIETIDDYAFYGCEALEEVHLPSTVKYWGSSVFADCKGLKKVTMDADFQFHVKGDIGVRYCDGHKMFSNCTDLEEVVLPEDLLAIPPYFVQGCTKLKSFPIPDGLVYWGSCPPKMCTGTYTLQDSIEVIGDGGFAGCSDLKELILPEGLKRIDRAFEGCSKLKTLEIPQSVTGMYATFYGCEGLESIVIPDTVVDIGNWTFDGCSNLKSVVLPDHISKLEYGFFKNCTSLKTVKLPSHLTCILGYAFEGCTGLTDIKIPGTVGLIGKYAFKDCTKLKKIKLPKKCDMYATEVFSGCVSMEKVELPENIWDLGDKMFYNCKSLSKITVKSPKLCYIGYQVFDGCKKLSSITIYSKKLEREFDIQKDSFDGIPKNTIIYVPKEKVKLYRKLFKKAKVKVDKRNIRAIS